MTRRRLVILAGLVTLSVAAGVAPWPAAAVESRYSLGVYAKAQPVLTAVSNTVPFSFLDVICIAAAGFCVRAVWRIARAAPGGRWRECVRQGSAGAILVAAGYLAFVAVWGLNYRRLPLHTRLDFDAARVTEASVRAFAADAVARANEVRDRLPEAALRGSSDAAIARALSGPFAETLAMLGLPPGTRPGRPKVPLLTVYFEAAGVSGMTNPFGLETLLADDLLPFERPLAVAHEWGHLAGFGPESEAGLIGFLTCLRGDPAAQYSAWLDVALRAARGLPVAERAELMRRLSPAVVAHLDAAADRSRRDQVRWLSAAAWQGYDTYLRAHRVEGGVRNYDAVVRLLVGTRFPGLNPESTGLAPGRE